MHRRPLGRGRRLAALAAVIILVACFLPWWQFGGEDGLPLRSGNAFEGAGILVFFVGLATIALLTLPYATDRPVAIDRGLTYFAIVAIGWIGLVLRAFDLFQIGALGLPTTAPGLWLAALGLGVLTRAAYEIAGERRDR
ncbi:MAG: hypothetical protein ACJ77F_03390 [Chloroflexota bacterium]